MKIRADAFKLTLFVVCSMLILALLYLTLGRVTIGPSEEYRAEMNDVSALEEGDLVKVAGVRVGQIDELSVGSNNQVLVEFHLDDDQAITDTTRLLVRYENLLGDRYVELQQGKTQGEALPAGSTIPPSRSVPALDLDVLLNGFRPLFRGLEPDQINELATSLISTLQGQGGTVEQLLARTASLTNGLADHDRAIGSLITNLDEVLGSLDSRDTQLRTTITQAKRLVTGLARDRDPIGRSITAISQMTGTLSDLFRDIRRPLDRTVKGVDSTSKVLVRNADELEKTLGLLPDAYEVLDRVGSHGSFFNFYLCGVQVTLTGADGEPIHSPLVGSNDTTTRCQS